METIKEMLGILCPNGVRWDKLCNVCKTIIPPCKLKTNQYLTEGPYLVIDQGQEYVAGYTDIEDAILPLGEYVLYGDHTCTVKYVDKQFAQGADGLKILKAKEDCITKYLYYALVEYNLTNTEYKRHWTQAKEIDIPLPPIDVQKEIVRILDTFTELQAGLEAELAARQKQYEYYRNKLLSFDEDDNSVEWKTLGEICDIKNGYTPSKSNTEFWSNGEIPWFRLEDIRQNGRILKESIQHVSRSAIKRGITYKKDSVIISTTATIGEHALITVPFICNQQISVLSIKDFEVSPKYLYYNGYYIGDWCKKNVNGAGLAIIPTSKLGEYRIAIPSHSRQRAIVDQLDTFEELISSLKREIELRKKQYEYYREQLLTFE